MKKDLVGEVADRIRCIKKDDITAPTVCGVALDPVLSMNNMVEHIERHNELGPTELRTIVNWLSGLDYLNERNLILTEELKNRNEEIRDLKYEIHALHYELSKRRAR